MSATDGWGSRYPGRCDVYWCRGELGELLYVGISACAPGRLDDHRKYGWWGLVRYVGVRTYETRLEASEVEWTSMQREGAWFNVRGRRGRPADKANVVLFDDRAVAIVQHLRAVNEANRLKAAERRRKRLEPKPAPKPHFQFSPEFQAEYTRQVQLNDLFILTM